MRYKQQIFLLVLLISSAIISANTVRGFSNHEANNIKLNSVREGDYGYFIVKFASEFALDNVKLAGDLVIVEKFKTLPYALFKGKLTRKSIKMLGDLGALEVFPNKIYKLHWTGKGTDKTVNSESTSLSIGADTFWNNGYTGTGIRVAVVDTGIDSTHPDLQGKIVAKKSFTLKKYGYPFDHTNPEDDIGHGTLVAGVIAGNGTGYGKGVAPNALLINAKVFEKTGPGIFDYVGTSAGIFAAVEWAVLNASADVINLSLGGGVTRGDPLVDLINYLADEYGVVFSISAGNEGQSGINTMSIGSPGVALNAITVGAATPNGKNIDSAYGDMYSSIGPTHLMYVKPEVSAPGTVTSTAMGGGYETASGTSFSAPHVAGAAALLVQYLKDVGVSSNVMIDVIKPLLIKTANPMKGVGELWGGAGFINLTRAYEFLQTASFVNGVPKVIDLLPKHIPTGYLLDQPYFPYAKRLFLGQKVEINITIYSSTPETLSVYLDGNISLALKFTATTINIRTLTDIYEFIMEVPENASTGYYYGHLIFSTGSENLTIEVSFYVDVPKARMAFDLKHTSWMIDFKYGQYREFFLLAENMSIAVEQIYYNNVFSYDKIKKYDIIFMPDFASYYIVWNERAFNVSYGTVTFTESELSALYEYVLEGGVIIAIAMDPTSNNVTEANRLASLFGMKYNKLKILGTASNPTDVKGRNNPLAVRSLPYYGMSIIMENEYASGIMSEGAFVGVASLLTGEGGIILSGSNFFFDNWAFNGKYGNEPSYVKEFFRKILGLGIDGFWPTVNVTTPVYKGDLINVTIQHADNFTVSYATLIDKNGSRNITIEQTDGVFTGSIEARVVGNATLVVELASTKGSLVRVSNVEVLEVQPPPEQPPEQPGGGEGTAGNIWVNIALIAIVVIVVGVGLIFYFRRRG